MRQYLKSVSATFILLTITLGAAWAAEVTEPPFLNCMGQTADKVIAIYGAPRLVTSEEVVLGFAYQNAFFQGRGYDLTYYIMGHQVVGVYYEAHRTNDLLLPAAGDWFEAYMGKSRRDIMTLLGAPDMHLLIFPEAVHETMEYRQVSFEGQVYNVHFALGDNTVFYVGYELLDAVPGTEMRNFVLNYDARVLKALNDPAWVLTDRLLQPNRPPDEDKWLFSRRLASDPYNVWLYAVAQPKAGRLVFMMSFLNRRTPGPYALAGIAADDEDFRKLLERDEELRRLAQTDEQFAGCKDFDWSLTRGNVEKLKTLPNYTETARP